jgi:hypothetical protein
VDSRVGAGEKEIDQRPWFTMLEQQQEEQQHHDKAALEWIETRAWLKLIHIKCQIWIYG